MNPVRREGDDLVLTIYVQPRASRDAIVGVHGDALKIAITAPPVDGAANAHLTAYLAKLFRVGKRQVTLVSGETGRNKRLRVASPQQIPPPIAELLTTSETP